MKHYYLPQVQAEDINNFTDNLRHKGIDADEGNNLLGLPVILKVAMSAQVNILASLAQEPVATAAITPFTTIIHCNKHTRQSHFMVFQCDYTVCST
jgi:hypothetical protein